jgi:hypothetical protein
MSDRASDFPVTFEFKPSDQYRAVITNKGRATHVVVEGMDRKDAYMTLKDVVRALRESYEPGKPWAFPDSQPVLYICERCGDVFRDDMPHAGYLTHLCPDGQEGKMQPTEDDGRELPVDKDNVHPDNDSVWTA